MLQNADDAKATKMYIILDKRKHPTKLLLNQKMTSFQGESLLFYNDKQLSEKDLKSIQLLGTGSKKEDNTSIGKFGYGFTSCFALTDVPSLVTGDKLCFFDPHAE